MEEEQYRTVQQNHNHTDNTSTMLLTSISTMRSWIVLVNVCEKYCRAQGFIILPSMTLSRRKPLMSPWSSLAHIGDRGVGDPVLRPREHPAAKPSSPCCQDRFSKSEATCRYHVTTVEGTIVDGSNEGLIVEG